MKLNIRGEIKKTLELFQKRSSCFLAWLTASSQEVVQLAEQSDSECRRILCPFVYEQTYLRTQYQYLITATK